MPAACDVIVHMTAADLPLAARDRLSIVLRQPDFAARQVVIHLGPGPQQLPTSIPVFRVHAPLPLRWMGSRRLERELDRAGLTGSHKRVVLHCWSVTAAGWCAPLASDLRRVYVEVASEADAAHSVCWPTSGLRQHTPTYICPQDIVRRRVTAQGVPDEYCVVIPPGVDVSAFDRAHRAKLRAALELDADHQALLALPPVTKSGGTLAVAWAGLLLEKIRPDVCVIVPSGGREHCRLRRLVGSCRHERVVRFARADLTLQQLLVAADLAVFLPSTGVELASVAMAMAARCPLVVRETAGTRALLGDPTCVWRCQRAVPADAAREMLRAIEDPDEARRRVDRARAHAMQRFCPTELIAGYRTCYSQARFRAAV